jgi:hypothetical protein
MPAKAKEKGARKKYDSHNFALSDFDTLLSNANKLRTLK